MKKQLIVLIMALALVVGTFIIGQQKGYKTGFKGGQDDVINNQILWNEAETETYFYSLYNGQIYEYFMDNDNYKELVIKLDREDWNY